MTTPPAGPQEALLRMFDEAEAWPDIRAAIYRVLVPEEAAVRGGAPAALREALEEGIGRLRGVDVTVERDAWPETAPHKTFGMPPGQITITNGRGTLIERAAVLALIADLRLSENTVDSLDELDVERLATAICATRLPVVDDAEGWKSDDECRAWAIRAARLTATAASDASEEET